MSEQVYAVGVFMSKNGRVSKKVNLGYFTDHIHISTFGWRVTAQLVQIAQITHNRLALY